MQCVVVDRVVLADEAAFPSQLLQYSALSWFGGGAVAADKPGTDRHDPCLYPSQGTLVLAFCPHAPEIALHTSTCNMPWHADA